VAVGGAAGRRGAAAAVDTELGGYGGGDGTVPADDDDPSWLCPTPTTPHGPHLDQNRTTSKTSS
jgi:hypothetical protein